MLFILVCKKTALRMLLACSLQANPVGNTYQELELNKCAQRARDVLENKGVGERART